MAPKGPSRFAFVDEGEAVRRLGVDRDTVLAFVRDGRLRAYPGVGKGSFFKVADLDALAAELNPPAPAEEVEAIEDEPVAKRPQHDPAYKVHLRLQADLKWYDLTEDDLRAWIRELRPDAYDRQHVNIEHVLGRLQRLLSLMEEAASHWSTMERQPS